MKREPTEWQNIFANTSEKGLIPKPYKELLKLNTKKTQTMQINRRAKDLNIHYSEEYVQMVNRHMKRCSMSLVIKEMQIKITMRYHLTPVGMTIINKSTHSKCW